MNDCHIDSPFSSIEDIIADARAGKMFILTDDEDRENEGDLVIPGQHISPEHINFMATHGRGLICLTLTEDRVRTLGLPPMARDNAARYSTAFTVSIEAREGVTTGISAADRSHTIKTAINPNNSASDIVTPGHIFPLEARNGGVLVRAGHTEAACDISALADLPPYGVICEILNDDGTMARLPDLIPYAKKHGLRIGAIVDLIAYRRRTESLVKRVVTRDNVTAFGAAFTVHVYKDMITKEEHVALVKGAPELSKSPVPVRMHAVNFFNDITGFDRNNTGGKLERALHAIDTAGCGVAVLLRNRSSNISHLLSQDQAPQTSPELRDYGIGAQILKDLGVSNMTLLTPGEKQPIGLEGYDLHINGTIPF